MGSQNGFDHSHLVQQHAPGHRGAAGHVALVAAVGRLQRVAAAHHEAPGAGKPRLVRAAAGPAEASGQKMNQPQPLGTVEVLSVLSSGWFFPRAGFFLGLVLPRAGFFLLGLGFS